MDARKRQQMLRIINLANRHPAYAKTIGVKANIQQGCEHSLSEKGNNMKYYLGLVTDNPNRNHEVHEETCSELPSFSNREYLEGCSTSREALREAERRHPPWNDIDGCAICCPEIHAE